MRVPSIAIHEILRGLAQVHTVEREGTAIEEVLASRPVVSHGARAARVGGLLEGALRAKGRPIEPEDCMIAAMAIVEGEEIVTANERDFARIDGLRIATYR